ncbi:MAG: hypothetical protein HY904_19355 [Deltaproteobacteria bacterium]|nr:hypothetical protein [Deltaproteobacteria bacterium]
MMLAAYVDKGGKKARVFSAAPLADAELDGLVAADMDEDDRERAAVLRSVLATGFAEVTVYPGGGATPDVLHAYVVGVDKRPVFATVVVSERRATTMVHEARAVVEGFSLQVAQGEDVTEEGLATALATWAGRNFVDVPAAAFHVERWLARPPSLPTSWELDASVADPPYTGDAA